MGELRKCHFFFLFLIFPFFDFLNLKMWDLKKKIPVYFSKKKKLDDKYNQGFSFSFRIS